MALLMHDIRKTNIEKFKGLFFNSIEDAVQKDIFDLTNNLV